MKQELKDLVATYLEQHLRGRRPENPSQNQLYNFQVTPLSPDGSDRLYFRISAAPTATDFAPFIAADAAGCGAQDKKSGLSQNNTFRLIQQHLKKLDFPVPNYLSENSAGDDLYLLEDLGNVTLHDFVKTHGWCERTITLYRRVLELLLRLQIDAAKTFSPDWAYAGGFYDYDLIVECELNYFLYAFVMGFCRIDIDNNESCRLAAEFAQLAQSALKAPADFFLYRDFQSKNLMLYQDKIFLIDFQGARFGPYYYDLAALINDPYVEMPFPLRSDLQDFYLQKLGLETAAGFTPPAPAIFTYNFALFSLIRTLQTLGAFGYLSGCGKKHFTPYIRPALTNFTYYLKQLQEHDPNFELNSLNLIKHKIKLWQNR